jgi:hypothetical protein
MYKIILIIQLLLPLIEVTASLPALSSKPVEKVDHRLKYSDILNIIKDAKEDFLLNTNISYALKVYQIINNTLQQTTLIKKIVLAQNPSDTYDLYLEIKDALNEILNNQKNFPLYWQNSLAIQKLRQTLFILEKTYPQNNVLKNLLTLIPEPIFLTEKTNETTDESQENSINPSKGDS